MHTHFDYCIKNGVLIPHADAELPVTNLEFAYGFGVYENIRVVRGKALFIQDHIDRLMRSAKVIGLEHTVTAEQIAQWTKALIEKCPADALNLKMLLIGAREPKGAMLFILPLAPLFPEKRLYTQGATTVTVHYERNFPDAKTLGMLGSYVAYRQAKKVDAYDALLIDHEGCITEGTRTNFFVIKDKTIIGAPKKKILEGVTMKHVLEVAQANGFSYEERGVRPEDIASEDGAFLTSTSSKIVPIRKIDDRDLKIPEALRGLMRLFDAFLKKKTE